MDNVTHTLFALTLARTPLGRVGRGSTAALVLASNAPDIDVAATLGGSASYLAWHRGPTHGLLGIVGLGLLTSMLVWCGRRTLDSMRPRPERRPLGIAAKANGDNGSIPEEDVPPTTHDAPFAMLVAISMIGVLLHVLMDLATSYGTRLLSPFDWHWFAADWLPIIDIYLLIALAAGLAFGRMSPDARRHNVAIALVLMVGNYALRGAAHHRALTLAPRLFGPTLPLPCDPQPPSGALLDSWPRGALSIPTNGRRCLVEMAAVPTFLSPFRWRVIAHLSNAYEIHDVDLLDHRFRTVAAPSEALWRLALRFPNQWTPAVADAARTRTAQIFLGFSRFPDARTSVDATGVTTVLWSDMRFAGGLVSLRPPARQAAPFTVTVQIGPDHQVLREQIGP